MGEKNNFTALILAGGKSSRMGSDKGLVEINGKKMVEHILDVVKTLADEILIVSNNHDYKNFGYPVVEDEYKECGPLGGLHAGLKNSKSEWNFVIACDLPSLTKDFLSFLVSKVEDANAIAPVHGSETEPLCAMYHKSALPKIESLLLKKDFKMQNVLSCLDTKFIKVPESRFDASIIFQNINTSKDLINISLTLVNLSVLSALVVNLSEFIFL